MIHRASAAFWSDYDALPPEIRERADKQFASLKVDLHHPSLRLKKIGERNGQEIWSARITLKYRALAIRLPEEFLWFWIGEHDAYDQRLSWTRAVSDL
jgi:hypothetical protein